MGTRQPPDATAVSAAVSAAFGAHGVEVWGAAANEPPLPAAASLPTAVSFLLPVRPMSLVGLEQGPTAAYVAEYRRVNNALVVVGEALVALLESGGYRAVRVDDDAPDGADDPPIFASKTAATQAGLGWIGKTALLVSHAYGSAARLGTVFTDLPLGAGAPVMTGRCGACRICVDACPADAGRDVAWRAGLPREVLYDATACDAYQRQFPEFDEICGICIWSCPYTRRGLRHGRDCGGDERTRRRAP